MYTNKINIQNYLMINISDSFESQLNTWISAVESWIDRYCGRSFESESTSKLYDGSGTKELMIDDLVSLTKIEFLDEDGNVDETISDSNDYFLYPSNETPKWKIVIDSRTASVGVFTKGKQNIQVTGDFGFSSSVPEDIKLAATKMVAGIIRESNVNEAGVIEKESLGGYSVSYADLDKIAERTGIKQILDQYHNISIVG